MKRYLVLALGLTLAACSHNPTPPPDPGPSCSDVDLVESPAQTAAKPTGAQLQAARPFDPTLIGGRPAKPEEWPASHYASAGNSRCSAVSVGPRTIAFAGHCSSNGASIAFSVGPNRYTARCTHYPEYARNSTADFSLCYTDRDVVGIPWEVMATENPFKIGDEARLTGYGCTQPGGGGGNDNIYRIGEARVTQLPSGNSYDTVTKGGAALCFGDSGGPAFAEFPDGSRLNFGVNSRGDIRTESYLSSWWEPRTQTWVKSWASQNNTQVCGVHGVFAGCRSVAPPGPSPAFAFDHPVSKISGEVKPAYVEKKGAVCTAVKKALESVK